MLVGTQALAHGELEKFFRTLILRPAVACRCSTLTSIFYFLFMSGRLDIGGGTDP